MRTVSHVTWCLISGKINSSETNTYYWETDSLSRYRIWICKYKAKHWPTGEVFTICVNNQETSVRKGQINLSRVTFDHGAYVLDHSIWSHRSLRLCSFFTLSILQIKWFLLIYLQVQLSFLLDSNLPLSPSSDFSKSDGILFNCFHLVLFLPSSFTSLLRSPTSSF